MSYASNLNSYLNPTPETIIRRGNYGSTGEDEAPASGSLVAPYPGMLLQFNTDGTVSVQQGVGVNVPRLFAIEDSLQGKTINDQYSQGDIVRFAVCKPGIVLQTPIPIGVATVIGTIMESAGDGSLRPVAGSGGGVMYVTAVNSTAIVNTSTQTAFNQSFSLPANDFQVGDVIHVVAQGKINNVVTNDTLTVRLKIGSTVIAATNTVAVSTNDEFWIDSTLVIRTVGAAGTFVAAGVQGLGTPGTGTSKPFYLDSTVLNTTANANTNLTVTATWNAASVNDNVQMNILMVERMRTTQSGLLAMAQTAVNNVSGSGYQFVDVLVF